MEMGENEREGVLRRGRLKRVSGWENQGEKKTGEWDFSGIGRRLSIWKLCLIDSSLRNMDASFSDNLTGFILAAFHQSQGFSPLWTGEAGPHSSQQRKTRWCIFVEEQEDLGRSAWRSCVEMRGCWQVCTAGAWNSSLSWNVSKANFTLSLILGAAFNESTIRSLHFQFSSLVKCVSLLFYYLFIYLFLPIKASHGMKSYLSLHYSMLSFPLSPPTLPPTTNLTFFLILSHFDV